MEFKGDKGTWTIYGDGKYQLTIDSRIDYGTAISGPKTIAIINTNGSKEEVLANGLLMSKSKELLEKLTAIFNMSEDKGTEGCTWGDTEMSSTDVAYGYNLALEHVKDGLEELINSATII